MSNRLSNKCAIIGVGESQRSRNSGMSPLQMALIAANKAIEDAGIDRNEIDGVMGYNTGDSCSSHTLATYLGIKTKYANDIMGGGSSTELLISEAVAMIDAGMLNTVLIFRSLNGASGKKVGRGYDSDAIQYGLSSGNFVVPYGSASPSQWFGMFANRHMKEAGLQREHLGKVCIDLYDYAQLNPNAYLNGKPLTMDKYLETPMISTPFTIHDSCVELDEANAVIVTSAARAKNGKSKPVYIMGLVARQTHPNAHYWNNVDVVAADYVADELYASAGIKPEDIDVASIYDCFSWVLVRQLEAYKLVKRQDLGDFIMSGNLRRGGQLPTNTAGGMLSEGYTHGMNNVLEIVRQVRHEYKGTERQIENCEIALCTGWSGPDLAGALILRN